MKQPVCESGTFALGVNYWPSETATEMWKKWNPDAIEKDFEVLEAHHLNLVRCFASWEDFQPIKFMMTPAKTVIETRYDDDTALPDTDAGRAGVSETMMVRENRRTYQQPTTLEIRINDKDTFCDSGRRAFHQGMHP